MSIEQLRHAKRQKRLSRGQTIAHAVRTAKADARARRLVELADAGASYEEIAVELGITVRSARVEVSRARSRTSSAA